jgi:hypothetical protein
MKTSSSYCMDVNGGFRSENNPIIMWPCHKGPNQKFKYNRRTKQIKSVHSRKCVDIGKDSRIVQRKCDTRKNTQKWKLKNRKWMSLQNKRTPRCINTSSANGIHLIASQCNKSIQSFTMKNKK